MNAYKFLKWVWSGLDKGRFSNVAYQSSETLKLSFDCPGEGEFSHIKITIRPAFPAFFIAGSYKPQAGMLLHVQVDGAEVWKYERVPEDATYILGNIHSLACDAVDDRKEQAAKWLIEQVMSYE